MFGDHLVSVRENRIVGHLVNIPITVNFVSINNNSVYRVIFLAKLYNIKLFDLLDTKLLTTNSVMKARFWY